MQIARASRLIAACLTLAAGTLVFDAESQTYPSRPITFLYPATGGSPGDVFIRAVMNEVTKSLGQPVVVEYRPGAAGMLGLSAVVNARGDAHLLTLALHNNAVFSTLVNPAYKFKPNSDYTPIALTTVLPLVLYANPAVPFRDLKGLVEYARANPRKLNVGSAGTASAGHFALELLRLSAGIDMTHIPYKGDPPMVSALLANEVQLIFTTSGAKPQVDAGRLLALATTGGQRQEPFADRPTLKESGIDVVFEPMIGIVAPAGIPAEAVQKLNTAINAALKLPEVAKRNQTLGGRAVTDSTPEQFGAFINRELSRLEPIVARAGLSK